MNVALHPRGDVAAAGVDGSCRLLALYAAAEGAAIAPRAAATSDFSGGPPRACVR